VSRAATNVRLTLFVLLISHLEFRESVRLIVDFAWETIMTSRSASIRSFQSRNHSAFLLLAFLSGSIHLNAQLGDLPPRPAVTVSETHDGFDAKIGGENLRLSVCTESVIHVVARPADVSSSAIEQPWLLPPAESCPGANFKFTHDSDSATLTTAQVKVTFSLKRGNLGYSTAGGEDLLRESDAVPRTYEPDVINGLKTYHVSDRFSPDQTEGYYGLGQHQSGMFNYRGSTVELAQNNTDVAIPLLLSSKGYALMWNTASATEVDNRFPLSLRMSSLAGNTVDYFFIYGPEFDQIIHLYRNLTGHSPMLPKWAYGLFQSKDRYKSQSEILDIAAQYRREHIPLDAIVQDWFWWKTEGDPIFNSNFTDIPAELKTLHDSHLHAMISVWGLFDPLSTNFQTIKANHYDIRDAHVYDATNPKAREFYWQNLAGKLFAQGWDAFWLDSAEPEEYWPHMGDAILRDKQLSMGSGAVYTNIFPLMHTMGVQEHWKAATDQKRVLLLTRSAFIGQQRVGATVWSGDVYSTYWGLSHQVSAGLNFALSGYPYWTTDIGGYWPPTANTNLTDYSYQELYTRWFEYGTFCPIFRTHGHRDHNELWTYDKVEPILLTYDKLRYRLMPYIYALAWRVHKDDYTIQRPLVMDWREDPGVRSIPDEFMFGPAILVNPVLKANATKRSVYLPPAQSWYDFWTGNSAEGGKDIETDAPLDRMPIFIRAGSVVPLGPEIEYADEKPDGPIELRVYKGADGSFELYADEGDNYNYEKGAHAVIPIKWSEADKTLSIGDRVGQYTGMPREIKFQIVWVAPSHGAGEGVVETPDRTVVYNGLAVSVKQP
jgi:alpha-D-xyloside xylohydrolase